VHSQADVKHGNTKSAKTDTTLKTRHFVDIVTEITRSMEIHREMGTILGGVHLELTGEVNEEGFSVVGLSITAELSSLTSRLSALEDQWNSRTRTFHSTTGPTVILD
jgi:3-deoxy-D-arabino-heptulosonate 7-phosphate (DAHP) synthase class II